jgi:hypothetical protein
MFFYSSPKRKLLISKKKINIDVVSLVAAR